ncbi:MAG TPA: YbaB/EbfC family nucleoid-associated protein [Candidatus Dojkabacteria bacterium]|jgi:DNA-binding YbaB/EbfC family protein|nr:YbaB/EbfC family nucleoid-associated protein [Candidatus Dojkabacteria bacterium]HOR05841.1 YbaB/EbfC family nucleoid-associated protein [Candidatus Dojkabacteria bacterium]HOT60997.1 YbaB/EbfC family nucleoid-associated protein [Candidatus Dojkabacteria bacterium]HQI92755.1 YbaB/EbfC family nucleoid-associated protein [Candidatus Dojkabacteria bacterium]
MINPVELLRMQNEAKKMQKKLRERRITGESKDGLVKLYMNAAQELEDLRIDDQLLSPDMSDELRKYFKDAFKDYQKKLQKEMVADMDLSQLKNMLG